MRAPAPTQFRADAGRGRLHAQPVDDVTRELELSLGRITIHPRDTVEHADLDASGERIGLRTIVHLQRRANVADGDAHRHRREKAEIVLRPEVERARRSGERGTPRRAVEAKLYDLERDTGA